MDKKEITAKLRGIRHSPYKMRRAANQVRNLSLGKAQSQLENSTKRAAGYILKALNSAVANAKNNFDISEKDLFVKELQVGDGRIYKKPKYRARGRMDVARTKYSNVRIVLGVKKEGPE